jgi:Flp pilus assembly protein TadB
MSKTCEICGRQIKTGRKYCWEHRYTSQSEKIKNQQKERKEDNQRLEELEIIKENYLSKRLGPFWEIIVKSTKKRSKIDITILSLMAFLLLLGVIFYFTAGLIAFKIILLLLIILLISRTILRKIGLRKRNLINKEIEDKNENFIKFAKNHYKIIKEIEIEEEKDMEFKKSLWN